MGERIQYAITLLLVIGILLGAILLARYNSRRGRGDRRGAFRLALFIFGVSMLAWLFGASHVPTNNEVARLFIMAVSPALLASGILWLVYLALEPSVRRRSPHTIISWSRVLNGSLRDPLVGRDLLVGVLFGISQVLIDTSENLVHLWLNLVPLRGFEMYSWIGVRHLIAVGFLSTARASLLVALFLFFLLFLFHVLTRRRWLAIGIFCLIGSMQSVLVSSSPMINAPFACLSVGLAVVVLLWFGLLAFAVGTFITGLLFSIPITTDFSAWYASSSLIVLLAIMTLAAFAFHTSLGGRKLFEGKLLDE